MTALTDYDALTRNRQRHQPEALFLHRQAIAELQDRLSMVNRTFRQPAIVSGFPVIWQTAFPEAEIFPDQVEMIPFVATDHAKCARRGASQPSTVRQKVQRITSLARSAVNCSTLFA